MFRHQGKTRTFSHNLEIASLLSFVAGMINAAGFLSLQILTTNVTGHFALFIRDVFNFNILKSIFAILYVLSFFFGSFVSSMIVEIMLRKNERYIFVWPIFIECAILLVIGVFGNHLMNSFPNTIAFSLLFSMGLQNSLVTRISGAVVRTTHLTGLFTDLGIDISLLPFHKAGSQRKVLVSNINLRLRIVLCFFIGGVFSGVLYSYLQLYVLLFSVILLLFGLVYDTIKFKFIIQRRRFEARRKIISKKRRHIL